MATTILIYIKQYATKSHVTIPLYEEPKFHDARRGDFEATGLSGSFLPDSRRKSGSLKGPSLPTSKSPLHRQLASTSPEMPPKVPETSPFHHT